jgi:uncharacterized membrane protein
LGKGSRQQVSTPPSSNGALRREEWTATYARGPLPNSRELAEYNKIIENAGERLMSIYERNIAHIERMDEEAVAIDKRIVDNDALQIKLQNGNIRRAQWLTASIICATLLSVAVLFAATCWLFVLGKPLPGVAFLALSSIVSIAGGNRMFAWIGAKRPGDKK